MMLPLHDTQVRLVLLNHVTLRLADARPDELDAVGIANEQLDRLRQLSALDLNRLAAMRTLTIGIALDGEALQAGLRTVALVKEAKALEAAGAQAGRVLARRAFQAPNRAIRPGMMIMAQMIFSRLSFTQGMLPNR